MRPPIERLISRFYFNKYPPKISPTAQLRKVKSEISRNSKRRLRRSINLVSSFCAVSKPHHQIAE